MCLCHFMKLISYQHYAETNRPSGVNESLLTHTETQAVYEVPNPITDSNNYYSSVTHEGCNEFSSSYSDARRFDQSIPPKSKSKKQPLRTFPQVHVTRVKSNRDKSRPNPRDRQTTLGIYTYASVTHEDSQQVYANVSCSNRASTCVKQMVKLQNGDCAEIGTAKRGEYEFDESLHSVDVELDDSFESSEDAGYLPYLQGAEYSYATVERPNKPVINFRGKFVH